MARLAPFLPGLALAGAALLNRWAWAPIHRRQRLEAAHRPPASEDPDGG